jgi:Protein of unknown function (DUF1097)
MSQRFRAVTPLALTIAVIAFLWVEFVLNFSFHWVVVKDNVFAGFGLPAAFTLVLPASFVSWGLFFALGADTAALRKTIVAAATGTIAGVIIMTLGPALAQAPKFWGIAVAVAVAAFLLVAISSLSEGDIFAPAAPFICAGTVLMWWFATGLDNYVPGGKARTPRRRWSPPPPRRRWPRGPARPAACSRPRGCGWRSPCSCPSSAASCWDRCRSGPPR